MNAANRKQLADLVTKLEALKASAEDLGNELRDLADAEQEKFENLAEGLQSSEQGEALESAASYLGEGADALEDANLNEALEALANLA